MRGGGGVVAELVELRVEGRHVDLAPAAGRGCPLDAVLNCKTSSIVLAFVGAKPVEGDIYPIWLLDSACCPAASGIYAPGMEQATYLHIVSPWLRGIVC